MLSHLEQTLDLDLDSFSELLETRSGAQGRSASAVSPMSPVVINFSNNGLYSTVEYLQYGTDNRSDEYY